MTTNPTINRSQIIDAITALQLPDGAGLLEVRIFKTESVNVFRTVGPLETYDAVDGPRPAKPLQHNHLPACCCQGEFTDCPACPEHGDHECPSCHAINGHAHTEYCRAGHLCTRHGCPWQAGATCTAPDCPTFSGPVPIHRCTDPACPVDGPHAHAGTDVLMRHPDCTCQFLQAWRTWSAEPHREGCPLPSVDHG